MRVGAGREGAKVRVDAGEAATLVTLLTDLLAALQPDGLDAHDPVRQRLFPDGYRDDPASARAFRDLTESSLGAERTERVRRCLAEVSALGDRPAQVVLDDEAGDRWLRVLADLRLAVGTRLGVTEQTDFHDGDGPDAAARSVYLWLTAVQDALVRALMN
ncbi:MAG: DUF2017 family protein [Jatrophihabitans sp.]|nr:MAG: DUF2017 family protein [Jatrophihabitans sp.]